MDCFPSDATGAGHGSRRLGLRNAIAPSASASVGRSISWTISRPILPVRMCCTNRSSSDLGALAPEIRSV